MDAHKRVACEAVLGYSFADPSLLRGALTHSSAKSETNTCNEREEFLGDAILGMTISEHLYHTYPDYSEGDLTKIKSVVVSRCILSRVSSQMGLQDFLVVGRGIADRKDIPRSLLANVFEAVVAAIYIDGGLESAREFVLRNLTPQIEAVENNQHDHNYKSLLQQFSQQHLAVTPIYRVVKEEGPDHVKMFHVVTVVRGEDYGSGWGKSKKQAEQRAAQETIVMLKERLAAASGGDQKQQESPLEPPADAMAHDKGQARDVADEAEA